MNVRGVDVLWSIDEMKRSIVVLAFAVLVTTVVCSVTMAADARPAKPNFIILFADDLGWGDVGFNGRKDWASPNLDKLAAQGTVFNRWYSGAAVCAPSRGVLMTGKYTIHNGVSMNGQDLPDEEVTIAEALKAQGYVTALFGKWHHGNARPGHKSYIHPMDQGFDEFFGFTDARHAWEHFPKQLWFGREMQPVSGHASTVFTDHAIDFLKRHKDQPFFLYLPYNETHFYIEAPAEDVARYKGKFPEKDPSKPYNATYAAMVTCLDRQIGRVLDTLDELNLADNTIVVFTSDQGATFEGGNQGASNFHDSNHPFRGQKRTLWEGGIRVPGVVRWPGKVPAKSVSPEIVHMIDVLPTFVAAAGGTPDPAWKVDGANMLPVWTGQAKAPDRTLFWEWRSEGTHQLAAMRGDLKLVITGDSNPELFDVAKDLGERRNIIAEHQGTAGQLEKDLHKWLATETDAAKFGRPAAKK
jgi:arylsulfatase A